MYTVYLVDDEKWALYDVRHTCPFDEFGFEVIGENTNAFRALDDILEMKPHVVFADIRMPAVTGLDLIHLIKQKLPHTIFVILSGYSEFEYATDALRLRVFDYCLKPMEEESARDLLQRLTEYIQSQPCTTPLTENEEIVCSSESFSALLRYVNQHINEPLVLGELAQRFFINVSYCGELFKSVTGENFTQYVRKKRIKQACELLTRTAMPMSQVAVRVGYSDLPYFSRLFAATMGVSPSRFRAMQREKRGSGNEKD